MIYTDPTRNPNSTELEIDKPLISRFVIDRLVPLNTSYPIDELMLMTAAVCRFKPTMIIEWGTNIGYSALIFHEIITSFNVKCDIHSIDLPDDVIHLEHDPACRGVAIKHISDIKLHQGDGLTMAINIVKDHNPLNVLFFVDGDHYYDSVKRELTGIVENVPKATILIHDTLFQSSDAGYNIGPYKAMVETFENTEFKILMMAMGAPGMSLVYHPSSLK